MKKKHLDNQIQDEAFDVPQEAIDSLARRLFPKMMKYFESEEGKREFEEWRKQKRSIKNSKGAAIASPLLETN